MVQLRTAATLFAAAVFASVLVYGGSARAGGDTTIVVPATDAAQGLDLEAVAQVFKDSKNLEDFERALNDPDEGINNLDLDGNGEVDFIRVVEQTNGDARIVVLQACLGDDDYQDVATIEVERDGDDARVQVHGYVGIYGPDYYVAPVHVVHVSAWPMFVWMYGPGYHPFVSAWGFGHYPHWWRTYRPVAVTAYRTRTVRFARHETFRVTRTTHVHAAKTVHYKARSSKRVAVHNAPHRTAVRRTNHHRRH